MLPIDRYIGQYSFCPVVTETVVLSLPRMMGMSILLWVLGSLAITSWYTGHGVQGIIIYSPPHANTSHLTLHYESDVYHQGHTLGEACSQICCRDLDFKACCWWVGRGLYTIFPFGLVPVGSIVRELLVRTKAEVERLPVGITPRHRHSINCRVKIVMVFK